MQAPIDASVLKIQHGCIETLRCIRDEADEIVRRIDSDTLQLNYEASAKSETVTGWIHLNRSVALTMIINELMRAFLLSAVKSDTERVVFR